MPSPPTVRVIETALLVLGGLAFVAWFLGTPDFNNVLEFGLDAVTRRGTGPTLMFFGIAAMGLLQLTVGAAVGAGVGGAWVSGVGWLLVGVDAVGAVGAGVLFAALSNFNMH
jgi:hypothetical protein